MNIGILNFGIYFKTKLHKHHCLAVHPINTYCKKKHLTKHYFLYFTYLVLTHIQNKIPTFITFKQLPFFCEDGPFEMKHLWVLTQK